MSMAGNQGYSCDPVLSMGQSHLGTVLQAGQKALYKDGASPKCSLPSQAMPGLLKATVGWYSVEGTITRVGRGVNFLPPSITQQGSCHSGGLLLLGTVLQRLLLSKQREGGL